MHPLSTGVFPCTIHEGMLEMKFTLAAALLIPFLGFSGEQTKQQLYLDTIDLNIPGIDSDKSIKYDFDIIYVRAPRFGDRGRSHWAEIAHPTTMDPGADLMLLHPDGSEEALVKVDDDCSVA